MRRTFSGPVFEWRGPAPHHFVEVPPDVADEIASIASEVSYGWGVIPATVTVGATTFTTSLFPREGGYLVPLKVAVRRAEGVDVGDVVALVLEIR
ncbi:DUF1905 domain-containing protein [Jatrophihabitans sp. YIM 134969]